MEKKSIFCDQTVVVTAKELRNIRFITDNTILVGNKILSFRKNTDLCDALWLSSMELSNATDDSEIKIEYYMSVETVSPNYINNSAMTVHEMFSHSLDHFVKTKDAFFGEMIKIIKDDDPVMFQELFGLQDALYFAMTDFPSCTNPDDLFYEFVTSNGYWWLAEYCGFTETLAMMREFFDRYYPIVKDRK